jgi:DNA repair exonuclease SbcCD ATPase subunit
LADTLDDLKRNLQSLANSISSKLNERQGYLDKADEIQKVYDRLARDKKTIKEYRNDIVYFYKESYNEFKGDNYKYTYKPSIQDLRDSYDDVISNIDINLDALNNQILSYKNKASGCLGSLGYMQIAYNSVKTQIQNWTN